MSSINLYGDFGDQLTDPWKITDFYHSLLNDAYTL